jgi:hypothetical protein
VSRPHARGARHPRWRQPPPGAAVGASARAGPVCAACSAPPSVPPRGGRRSRRPARGAHLARQFEQPQRVPLRLGHDAVANLLVELTGYGGRKKRSRVFVGESLERQARQGGKQLVVARFSDRIQQQDRLRQEAPADESQDLARRFIEPLGIVDEAHERTFRGRLAEQAEHGGPGEEQIRSVSGLGSEGDAQCVLLRRRERIEMAEDRLAELVHCRERHRQLGLDADNLGDATAGRLASAVLHQSRLADPRLTAYHEHRALALPNAVKHSVEVCALACPPSERGRPS